MSLLTAPALVALDPTLPPLAVTLYTRALCCCCQTAREVLAEYQSVGGVVVKEVDAEDPALGSFIGPTVPVIAVAGKVRFRGEVNRVLLDRLIAARTDRG